MAKLRLGDTVIAITDNRSFIPYFNLGEVFIITYVSMATGNPSHLGVTYPKDDGLGPYLLPEDYFMLYNPATVVTDHNMSLNDLLKSFFSEGSNEKVHCGIIPGGIAITESAPSKCECGVASIGGGKHSSYCPLHE